MSLTSDCVVVADAIRRLYAAATLPWPPHAGSAITPVPLDRLIATYNLVHDEIPGLTRATAAAYLLRWNICRPDLLADATPLAGFLFANAGGGYILVNREDSLPRRRFTAAHELGHYLLHFLPRLHCPETPQRELVQDDKHETIVEEEKASQGDGLALSEMERQANRFAAELLMPAAVCRALRDRYAKQFGLAERFLEQQLASILLVSREATRWRLKGLTEGKQQATNNR